MSKSGCSTAFILPLRETFAPAAAGAISLIVQRLAAATPQSVVFASPCTSPFPNITISPWRHPLALALALRKLQPATVEVHQQPRLAQWLRLVLPRRCKIMLFLHNNPLSMRGLKSAAMRRLTLASLHKVVVVSAYLQSRYMQGLGYTPPPAILPNPLSLKNLPPQPATKSNVILFAGRIVADKGADIFSTALAQALPHLPGWTARMIGGDRFGPHSPQTAFVAQVRASAQEAGIIFSGPQPHATVLAAMAQAAIVVVPSRWEEPFGLTALEAIASGAALITTPQGGLPEIAGNAACYTPAGDAPALAAAILALARNPQHRATLAAAGLARAQAFNTPEIIRQLEALRA